MSDFRQHLEEALGDEAFRAEWDAQEAEREVTRALVEARIEAGFSQIGLAEACGMKASSLCRIESGRANPSIATLSRLAHGMGRRLRVEFV